MSDAPKVSADALSGVSLNKVEATKKVATDARGFVKGGDAKSSLKSVTTKVTNSLPTAEDIAAEKKAAAE